MLFTLALLVLSSQALASIQAGGSLLTSCATPSGDDIGALCAGKNIDLTTITQVKELNHYAWRMRCHNRIEYALKDMVELIEHTQGDLCSADSIDHYKEFYEEYLDTRFQAVEGKVLLPKSLKRFMLAYGMQMSNVCKRNMVKELIEEADKLIAPEDFKLIEPLIRDESPIAQVLSKLGNPGDVLLPGDFVPFLRGASRGNRHRATKIFIQTATSSQIEKLQSTCRERFRPVYEPLMRPLVRLANLGFNYMDEPLKCNLKSCPATVHEVAKWSRIVVLCDAITSIVLVEDPKDQELTEGTDTKLIKVITKEEARAMRGGGGGGRQNNRDSMTESESDADDEEDDDDYVVHHEEEALPEYKPRYVASLPDDKVYNKADKRLRTAVKSFKTDRDEDEVFKRRILSRATFVVKNQLKQGHIGVIVSAAFRTLVNKQGRGSPSEEIVKILDALTVAGAQNASLDAPVSSMFKSYTKDGRIRAAFMIILVVLILGCVGVAAAIG